MVIQRVKSGKMEMKDLIHLLLFVAKSLAPFNKNYPLLMQCYSLLLTQKKLLEQNVAPLEGKY